MKAELPAKPLSEILNANEAGRSLQDLRERFGITQAELSSATGISQRHISFIENGKATPSRSVIQKLAAALSLGNSKTEQILERFGYSVLYSEEKLPGTPMTASSNALAFMLENHDPLPAFAADKLGNILHMNGAGRQLAAMLTGNELLLGEAEKFRFQDLLLNTSGRARFIASQEILVSTIRSLQQATSNTQENSGATREITLLKALLDEHGELLMSADQSSHLPVYEAAIRIGDELGEWRMSWLVFVNTEGTAESNMSNLLLLMPSNLQAVEQARRLFGF